MWNTLKGFWHSHSGWLFNANWSKSEREQYVPDLMNDPLLRSIDKNYSWWVVATLIEAAQEMGLLVAGSSPRNGPL